MRVIQNKENMRWIIYTDSLSSKFAIENNRKNHPILNQIFDILGELHNQGKQNTLCKVTAHIEVKGNEEADKAEKQSIDMPELTTTTDYMTIRKARNFEWQKEQEKNTSKLH